MNLSLPLSTRVLHWLVALGMIFLLATGWYMASAQAWSLYLIHKSIGVILFFFVVARVVVRLKNGMPAPLGKQGKWLHRLAKTTHWGLLATTLIMPISGAVYSWASGHYVGVFAFDIVPDNPVRNELGEVLPRNVQLQNVALSLHQWVGYLMAGLLGLHLIGALKHHFVDRDDTLRRMLKKLD
jgi:cytochrome b561